VFAKINLFFSLIISIDNGELTVRFHLAIPHHPLHAVPEDVERKYINLKPWTKNQES